MDNVGIVTLSRPPVNAIDAETLDELYQIRDTIASDSSIRAVVVRSTQRVFCAGVDIHMIQGLLSHGPAGQEDMLRFIRRIQGFYTLWQELDRPTVAAMTGSATGGGLEFALASDLRVASRDARFGLTEVKIGLLPGAGGTQRLTRVAGLPTATRLILTGDLVSGAEAERLGIVHIATDQGSVERVAIQYAADLASRSRAALREIKRCLAVAPSQDGFDREIDGSARLLADPESSAFVNAFFSRRAQSAGDA